MQNNISCKKHSIRRQSPIIAENLSKPNEVESVKQILECGLDVKISTYRKRE